MTVEEYNRLCAKMIERMNLHDDPMVCIWAWYNAAADTLHTFTPEALWIDL